MSEKDFWIEMAIREIWTQCHFAEIAYHNIDLKAANVTDVVFSSIHSFLSHCANVSKMLKASNEIDLADNQTIGQILDIDDNSIIHKRTFRNHLEHYDERLKKWIHEKGTGANIGTYNIGPKSAISSGNFVFVKHYDPTTDNFTFVDEDINLGEVFMEIQKIKTTADEWVKLNHKYF